MMPLTPAAELRDDPEWVEEMLPSFEESCSNDKGILNDNYIISIVIIDHCNDNDIDSYLLML